MGRHKKPPEVTWPLDRRKDTEHDRIPHDGARLVETGSAKTVSCFRCGSSPCTCPHDE